MLAKIDISDDDILYAESILLPKGKSFDLERRDFIRNMDTIDLQAVPGSGKTTALMAKLLILNRYLPLPSGRGVVVISHTNAAIDEIKDKIGRYCPKIFSYPNFIGTIQSFVNEFLAAPYFEQIWKRSITRIDDDSYNERYLKFGNHYIQGLTKDDRNRSLSWLNANSNVVIRWTSTGEKLVPTLLDGQPPSVKKPRGGTWSLEETKVVENFIVDFKKKIISNGYIRFDESYALADLYIKKYPSVKFLMQSRFAFCFVDEMQDMDEVQYSLLEEVFYNKGLSSTNFQRIGDKNQSIYNNGNKNFWIDRGVCLRLRGSHRLTKEVAEVVKHFAVFPSQIIGLRMLPSGSIKPHLLVYDNNTIKRVIPFYNSLISSFIDSGAIADRPENKYKVIGWTDKIGAADAHTRLNNYKSAQVINNLKNPSKAKTLFHCLSSINTLNQDFSEIEQEVVGVILRLLQQEEITDGDGYPFTKNRLNDNLRNSVDGFYDDYRFRLFQCCSMIAKQFISDACSIFNVLFGDLLSYFENLSSSTLDYRTALSKIDVDPSPIIVDDELSRIEVQSVHSVKGETHTTTMYVETFYQKFVGGGSYESQRLTNPFDLNPLSLNPHDYVLQSMKMVYVGFSRPTHLLCFAVHIDRSKNLITKNVEDCWEVLQVT